VVPVQITALEFLEIARKVLSHAGVRLRDRSIITTMVQTGMDDSTLAKVFNYVAFPQLARAFKTEDFSQWDEGLGCPVRIDLVRPKTDYRYYSFLDKDAVTLLKEWLAARQTRLGPIRVYRPKNPKQMVTSDPIYVYDYGPPLAAGYVCKVFRDWGKVAGVNQTPEERVARYHGASIRYPFHSHECRDTLVTLGRRVGVDLAVVNFFVGHSIDRLGYDKSPWDHPEHFRAQYAKLTPYLNLISGTETRIKEETERKFESKIDEQAKQISELSENLAATNRDFKRLLNMVHPSFEAMDKGTAEKLAKSLGKQK